MNWIDFCVFFILLYFVSRGYAIGFLTSLFNLISTVFSLVIAISFYHPVGSFFASLGVEKVFSPIVGFFALFILFEIILSWIFSFFYQLFFHIFSFLKPLIFIDKIFGAFAQLLVAFVFLVVAGAVILRLPFSFGFKSAVVSSFWGQEVLPRALVFEPSVRSFLGMIPQGALVYLIPQTPDSGEHIKLNFVHVSDLDLVVDERSEDEMVDLVNKERSLRGLKILIKDPRIIEVCRQHSFDMFKRSYFSHNSPEGKTPFDRMTAGGVEYTIAGENLAFAPTVEIAHKGLMNSPGHRANILRPEFGRIGVGVVDGGIYGKMFTQNFAE